MGGCRANHLPWYGEVQDPNIYKLGAAGLLKHAQEGCQAINSSLAGRIDA